MKKLVRYGLLLFIVSMIGLSIFLIGTQVVYANVEAETEEAYTPAEKAAAIKAANDEILRIPRIDYLASDYVITAEQRAIIDKVAEVRALVDLVKEEYDAEDSDFLNLDRLIDAEKKVGKILAVIAARDAIDAIPEIPDGEKLTDEYRAAVEKARQLVDIAMQEHGATYFDICWRYHALEDAEKRIDEEPEPEPEPVKPDDRRPTPPTGGLPTFVAMGVLLSGAGLLFFRRRTGRH
jgi:hypothetical protein